MARRPIAPVLSRVVKLLYQHPDFMAGDYDGARRELRALKVGAGVLSRIAPMLRVVAYQLRCMGQCRHCGNFDVNGQARTLENIAETLRRLLARLQAPRRSRSRGTRHG